MVFKSGKYESEIPKVKMSNIWVISKISESYLVGTEKHTSEEQFSELCSAQCKHTACKIYKKC